MPPAALAIRNLRYGTRSAPASGPARMRSSATNRPKKTAQTPHLSKMRSARARCGGAEMFGEPAAEPLQQRTPAAAADRIADGVTDDRADGRRRSATPQMLLTPVAASSEALTRVISPGRGTPMLSSRMMAADDQVDQQ